MLLVLPGLAGAQLPSVEQQLQNAAGNMTTLRHNRIWGWTDGPIYRGTASILWSCLVTIFVTIYTVIHMNTPVQHQSTWIRIASKVRWTLVAIIGPELILHSAIIQFRAAQSLVEKLNEIAVNQDEAEDADVRQSSEDSAVNKVRSVALRM